MLTSPSPVTLLLTALVAIGTVVGPAQAEPVTILYDDEVVEIERTLADPNDLWVVPEDLTRLNGFELKAEGICLDQVCIPVRQDRDTDILITRGGQVWINVTEMARKLSQPYAVDHDHHVWSFGAIPLTRTRFLNAALAPDFALPNREGELVRLSDFRGKKVLILTWASW